MPVLPPIISVINGKGGVGKTSLTANLGGLFGVAVLLVTSAGLSALDAAHDLDALLDFALSAARNLPGG